MEPTSLRFARLARTLTDAARANGLSPPTFRSPPRVAGVTRTLRRSRGGGAAVVSVVIRDRPWPAVAADMVEGVVVANDLRGVAADRMRATLWAVVADSVHRAA